MQNNNRHSKADDQDQIKDSNNPVSSTSNLEDSDHKKVVYPSKGDDDREKKQDNESGKTKKRSEPLTDKSDKEEDDADTITVDENYPGPKESDAQEAEKPGIKGHEAVDHGDS